MSFASQTKQELFQQEPKQPCCANAECYGLFLFAKSFHGKSIVLTTENGFTARLAAQLAAQTAGVIAEVRSPMTRRGEKKGMFGVTIQDDFQRAQLLSYFGHDEREIGLRMNRANLEEECCQRAFLRGAFLSCGTVVDPQKSYRIEFYVPFLNLAKDLSALLRDLYELQLCPSMTQRQGGFAVLIKSGGQVRDLLVYLGAKQAAMELIQTRMFKEVRNQVNRKTNFETANLDKTALASARQLLAIQKIEETITIDGLPAELRELARLRIKFPELSLRELGERLAAPMSRSGINHRLRRLVEIGEKAGRESSTSEEP